MFRGAISEIVLDDSFMVESTQAQSCLLTARKLISLLSEEAAEQKKFTEWIHAELFKIVSAAQIDNQVNEDTLW